MEQDLFLYKGMMYKKKIHPIWRERGQHLREMRWFCNEEDFSSLFIKLVMRKSFSRLLDIMKYF